MRRVIVTKYGNNIDLSVEGQGKLPDSLRALVAEELTYTHVVLLRGPEAWDEFGQRRTVKTERKRMYVFDGRGRLVCKAGFLPRLRRVFKENNIEVVVADKTPAHPRPDRYDVDWDVVFKEFTPRARQDEALLKIVTKDCGIFEAPTGYGKSHSFKMVAGLLPKANILIVVSRQDVAEDIYRGLTNHFPNVGMIGAGKRQFGRVTVCMAQSLRHAGYDRWDVVLCDEAHELAAPTFAAHLAVMESARMFGFSASPWGRRDGTSIRLEAIFGETVFHMSYQEAVDLGLVVPIRVKWLDVISERNPAGDYRDTARLRNGLWRNEERNKVLADEAASYGPEEQVLIMVAHFEHAVYLKSLLPDFTLCYAERHEDDLLFDRAVRDRILPADEPRMTAARRSTLRKQFESGELRKVIATDVWSTGVNFCGLSVLVRADARGSDIMDTQIPGRVSRPHTPSEKTYGLLIDCLDQFDDGFRSAARKRRRNYEQKGWEQILPGVGPRLDQS